jgi:hypothetical protein
VGRTYDGIDDRLRRWIERQPLSFVATAPRADDGQVNASPKGPIGSLRVLGPHEVAYLTSSAAAPRRSPTFVRTGAS